MSDDLFDFSQEASMRRWQLRYYWALGPSPYTMANIVWGDESVPALRKAIADLKENHPEDYQLLAEHILLEEI
jgi:hypothetical protein